MIRIIANPVAGGGRALSDASRLARVCADSGIPTHVHVASSREDTVRTARESAPLGLVVACGGDGTVHDCLNGVMTAGLSEPKLAIWPAGTGNDIVRGLELAGGGTSDSYEHPLRTEHFADAVLDGSFLRIDVGSAVTAAESGSMGSPVYFLGVLSCGFDSDVNERANAMPARVGKARYLLGVARELPSFRPRWYAIDSDGADSSMAGMVLAVGNGPAYGSGMMICPAADMTDGLLDVTLVTDTSKRTFVSVLPRVYTGRHIDHPSVVSWQASKLRIDAPDALVYADGERLGPLPAVVEIRPGGLEVLNVPRT